jgi:hypothetical protein
MICKRCVLPEHKPEIWLNEEGVCNICIESDKRERSGQNRKVLESDLIQILDKYRGRSRYDCLAMCSGGKDSIASLYYLKTRYKLNPLAFTFDNGFENAGAIRNVKNATDILKVDWEYSKSTYMNEMYAELIKAEIGFPVCLLCSLWYMQKVYEAARYRDLKLIIGGWTSGQCNIEDAEMQALTKDIPGFIDIMRKKYDKYRDFPKNMEEVRKRSRSSRKERILSVHWFLPREVEDYTEVIKKELNWKPIEYSYPANSTNCAVNSACSYISLKNLGFTHFHVEKSKLVRQAKLIRQDALDSLPIDINKEPAHSSIQAVIRKLGCTHEDCEA